MCSLFFSLAAGGGLTPGKVQDLCWHPLGNHVTTGVCSLERGPRALHHPPTRINIELFGKRLIKDGGNEFLRLLEFAKPSKQEGLEGLKTSTHVPLNSSHQRTQSSHH